MELLESIVQSIFELLEFLLKKTFSYIFNRDSGAPDDKVKLNEQMIGIRKSPDSSEFEAYSVNHKKMIKHSGIGEDGNSYFNTVIVGASRSGKTNLISNKVRHLMDVGHPFILIDPKADNLLIQLYLNMAKLTGRDLAIFSHREDLPNGVNYNPLRKGDLNAIVDRIMNGLTWTNEFYRDQCYRATHCCVQSVMKQNRGVIDLPRFYDALEVLYRDPKQCKKIGIKPDEIVGLINQIQRIVTSPYGKFLKEVPGKTINFSDAWNNGIILLIDLSVLKYPVISQSLNSFFISELLFTIGDKYEDLTTQKHKDLTPYHILLDEFGDLVVDNVIGIINKSLGVKLNTTISMQTDSDILRVDRHLLERIKVNTHKWYIFNQRTESAASAYGSDLGTVLSAKFTTQTDNGEDSEKGSKREAREMCVHPDIIKKLNQGQCIMSQIFPAELHLLNTFFVNPDDVEKEAETLNVQNRNEIEENIEILEEAVVIKKTTKSLGKNENLSDDGLF